MPKKTSIFFCSQCGNEFAKWSGQCPACKEWNTLTEAEPFLRKTGKSSKTVRPAETISVQEALKKDSKHTFSTSISELDRVLGPGLTKGAVYLLAGQPGIGKSTLLTQVCLKTQTSVFYVCSEENPAQVATRLQRLSKTIPEDIHLLDSSAVEDIAATLAKHPDSVFIVDSIQSVYSRENPTTPGSPSQVRDSASILIQAAKEHSTPLIIVGHVTKEGSIAGPKMLEHMVDVVMELSGDRQYQLRLLRTIKNRFGPTDETGIFTMGNGGLEEVTDPGKILLEGRLENSPGSALTMIMEGTRPLTVEIQALIVPTTIPVPRRIAKGISGNRLQLICAILTRHLHLPLGEKDVFVNVTGGMDIKDPGADLGVALAILSSVKNKALPAKSICFGELGLLGEIRNVAFTDKMAKEAKKLGYTSLYSPSTHHTLKSITL
ncbi:MAG: repair protein radA protein [Candidatus Collierbacteria bacterium GW2011_GWE1_46_18]|uniref:DNA repair protein RadA n=1 Tax=Candidatus Collierbacteria bacterium GW2011_GWE1_46_18 TaxID=1618399 RepID=A0A0G1S2S2_9BACT|nr:MAG: repair protein radA protein [Candidatus Collierbacteria bacterium GW2011_GWE1_46_18]